MKDSQGNPISDATIEIYDGATLIASTTTDAAGNYWVDVPEGTGYTLQVTADGYETIILDMDDVVEDETLSLNLEMDPRVPSGMIAGVLLDADGGAPIAGATVEVYDGATRIRITTTDAEGEYFLEVPVGEGYRVQATADGYETTSNNDVDVTEDGTTTVVFDLTAATEPTGTIQGVVRDNDGLAAISGATVEVYDGANLLATAITDAGGAYSLQVPVGQDYRVQITVAGYDSANVNDVDVTEGATTTVDLDLDVTTGTIQGSVRRGAQPIGAAIIRVYDGVTEVATGTTDGDGAYSVVVPVGTDYRVNASLDGFTQVNYYDVDVAEGETVTLNFLLVLSNQ